MSHLFWLKEEHLKRIQHLFPKPRGVARVNDRKVLHGVIHVVRNDPRWRDAHLKAHRTASSMGLKKGGAWSPDWSHQGRSEFQTARRHGCHGSSDPAVPDRRERQ